MLACHVRNCTKDNFPLAFADVELVVKPAEENLDFLRRFLPKLDWRALVDTARSLGDTALPDDMPATWTDEQLQALHHVLLEIHVEEGKMICRGCGHVYPIQNGIPNMLLAEHEISR
ncbi:uncharacterized protein EHS24_005923 [Apiotrichum porosum]|uniref:Multifunctional methyltransferase subunit trm112 n=1 Tax=Apiotrichum porosum TaxID=105984 RepID=A0A427Y020_9TREE|nr:uncharacterized protein EHS24_005923 [Apiotrichum porosum]RSH84403.1 hypothetical protein EHS24_005923 [Apiotrichum porosum]